MKLHAHTLLVLVSSFVAHGCVNSHSETSTAISTESGIVEGLSRDGYSAYLGIPYAAPPTGELRFAAPQPASPWSEPLAATELGPSCPQISSEMFGAIGPMDEDCLTLNVWTPTTEPNELAPVMLWIHGGGFMYDTANRPVYDGRNLARNGAVLVSFNYRLGPLGFLAHPTLTEENENHPSSGNYGIQDQQAVLKWVKANIASFGGDPNNITIFGESAGASSVCLHLVMPESRGLFHRAVLQSGVCGNQATLPTQEEQGEVLAHSLGCSDAESVPQCLRSKPVEEILTALPLDPTIILRSGTAWGPNVDEHVIPTSPIISFAVGDVADVPIILGANSDEGEVFVAMAEKSGGTMSNDDYEFLVNKFANNFGVEPSVISDKYPLEDYASPAAAISTMLGDGGFICPARTMARFLSMTHDDVYLYHFTEHFVVPDYPGLGAFHTAEIPFLFESSYMGGQLQTDQIALSDAMVGYWTSFAATGTPNLDGEPTWPRYEVETDQHMLFGQELEIGRDLKSEICDFWYQILM